MTPRERILSAIRGKEVDRIPWSPFLAYYWEAQSQDIQAKGQLDFFEEIGADPMFRGFHQLFKIKYNKCKIHETVQGNEKLVEYDTPVGRLKEKYIFSTAGNTWFLVEHPVKEMEDFKILTYINDDMEIIPDFSEFHSDYLQLGDRGVYFPVIGSEHKTSFQSLIEHWVGTEDLVYALADYPEVVEECLGVMRRKSVVTIMNSVESLAEAFIFWEDSSTTNISPSFFEKYAFPEINEWGRIIHNAGKCLIHHACGHLRGLLPLMAETEIDMIESISPPPTGNIQLHEARNMLPEHIGLIGGVEPTVFLNSTMEYLEKYVVELLEKIGDNRFILANSDSCPPGVSIEKFRLVSGIVKNFEIA